MQLEIASLYDEAPEQALGRFSFEIEKVMSMAPCIFYLTGLEILPDGNLF